MKDSSSQENGWTDNVRPQTRNKDEDGVVTGVFRVFQRNGGDCDIIFIPADVVGRGPTKARTLPRGRDCLQCFVSRVLGREISNSEVDSLLAGGRLTGTIGQQQYEDYFSRRGPLRNNNGTGHEDSARLAGSYDEGHVIHC